MRIELFRRSTIDWILVAGIRPVPQSPANTTGGFAHGYDAHWSIHNTWSSTAPAMSFSSKEAAERYLVAYRRLMEDV